MKGLVSQTLDWLKHPVYSDANIGDWAAFLTLILVLAFLWRAVIQHVE